MTVGTEKTGLLACRNGVLQRGGIGLQDFHALVGGSLCQYGESRQHTQQGNRQKRGETHVFAPNNDKAELCRPAHGQSINSQSGLSDTHRHTLSFLAASPHPRIEA